MEPWNSSFRKSGEMAITYLLGITCTGSRFSISTDSLRYRSKLFSDAPPPITRKSFVFIKTIVIKMNRQLVIPLFETQIPCSALILPELKSKNGPLFIEASLDAMATETSRMERVAANDSVLSGHYHSKVKAARREGTERLALRQKANQCIHDSLADKEALTDKTQMKIIQKMEEGGVYSSCLTLETEMTVYKLVYFNVMGLGEPIRYLLSYGGVQFEDVRLQHGSSEWSKMKPTTPFGQVPTLEVDGKVYSQTLPICHYLAKQFNLLGKTDLDTLQIDAIANALADLRRLVVSMYYREQDPDLKAKRRVEVFANTIPFYLNKLEELVKNNDGYLYGGQLSYADLFFVAISDSLSVAYEADITKDSPHLKALKEKVLAIPSIKAWVEKRPKTDF